MKEKEEEVRLVPSKGQTWRRLIESGAAAAAAAGLMAIRG